MYRTTELIKRIRYIPGINAFNLLLWVYACLSEYKYHNTSVRSLVILLKTGLPFGLIYFCTQVFAFDNIAFLTDICVRMCWYFFPLVYSNQILKYAEELQN